MDRRMDVEVGPDVNHGVQKCIRLFREMWGRGRLGFRDETLELVVRQRHQHGGSGGNRRSQVCPRRR